LTLPTVAEILAIPEMLAGEPQVVAGSIQVNNAVRWVHISELADIAPLLTGGELLLTTGIALPTTARALEKYIRSLAEARVAGLVIELGRKFQEIPEQLLLTADSLGMPVIRLNREVRFVKITEQAHALIINSQLDELRARQAIHERFTEMALEGASAADIVRAAASMTHRPVLLANRMHQVLVYEAGDSAADVVLDTWRSISHQVAVSGKTEFVQTAGGWLITPVGARGEIWGRLAMPVHGERSPNREWAILERAAMALAMNRLVERDRETLELQSHKSLLSDLVSGTAATTELQARASALGVPLGGRTLVACVIKVKDPTNNPGGISRESRDRDIGQWVASAAREAGVPTLIGMLGSGTIGALATFPNSSKVGAQLDRLATAVVGTLQAHGEDRPIVAVGSNVDSVRDIRRSFREAEQVAEAALETTPKTYYQLPDIRLRGLLHLLRGDARIQAFCDRELGRLLAIDRPESTQLMRVLKVFLECGGNKSTAAAALRVSRPALYSKLARIQTVLGVDLETADSRLSLHVALIGLDAAERHPS
jgi:purine catabolism regulator